MSDTTNVWTYRSNLGEAANARDLVGYSVRRHRR